ncbi:hypothetical protein N656DRAFT_574942 [Canariomyces notabilis]|uniref:Uncharacterized protein n=1 Tax=Canariomyces notabilis TaxID=2074819 RepID=A0AAN6YV55_9PEZI|nr:hypothetical protein N656DRAFT_574942 [Canariomyces arenarius]
MRPLPDILVRPATLDTGKRSQCHILQCVSTERSNGNRQHLGMVAASPRLPTKRGNILKAAEASVREGARQPCDLLPIPSVSMVSRARGRGRGMPGSMSDTTCAPKAAPQGSQERQWLGPAKLWSRELVVRRLRDVLFRNGSALDRRTAR